MKFLGRFIRRQVKKNGNPGATSAHIKKRAGNLAVTCPYTLSV